MEVEALIALLGDSTVLSIIKGTGVAGFWKGVEAKGLIDPQDVGTMTEATMILVDKYYPRTLKAGIGH